MSDPEAEPKHETTRLGSYTIVRKLARGGMAELYLARSVGPEGFEKLVVLKKILPRYAENPRFVQLFLDEAKLAASLDHPHIAHVYDMGRVDGNYFFTMEYVHGQDVRSILRRTERNGKKMPIELPVQIVRNIASALHYAHERRRPDGTLREIVHRDVSPSNILVSYDGAVKLADFGVAKAASSSVRTRTGTLKGKVGYMSPEQARGAQIDRRSDIFSLGVVLWELVAIRRLFKSDNDLATIQSIINNDPPSLAELRDDCPPELDKIVQRALEKDPATRYQTAQELQRDLEELAREHKLNQSSIALSNYLNTVFDAELSAWREAQAVGVTVTDYVVATDLTTPVSESDLSLEDEEPSFDEEDLDDVEADAAEEDSAPEVPELPPASGIITNDAELEATAIGAPPLMLDSQVTKVQVEPFEAAATAVHENPFSNDGATALDNPAFKTAIRPNPFGEELPTVQSDSFPDERPTIEVGADMLMTPTEMGLQPPAVVSVHVHPQTPPIGVPAMPHSSGQMQAMPHRPGHSSQPPMHMTPMGPMAVQATPQHPYPVVSTPHGALPPEHELDLTPHRKILIAAGIAVGVLVLIIIIAAIASGGGSDLDAATPDAAVEDKPAPKAAAPVEAPKRSAPKVEPKPELAKQAEPAKPEPKVDPKPEPAAEPKADPKPEPAAEPAPAATETPAPPVAAPPRRPVKFKPPKR